MPSKEDHLHLAQHNAETIAHLLPDCDRFPDWITTIAFYQALHLVEALFAQDHPVEHGRDHQIRGAVLKKENRYKAIHVHYSALKEASSVARYLSAGKSEEPFKNFSDYLTPELVESKILGHRLHQLKQSVTKLLSQTPRPRKKVKKAKSPGKK